MNRVFINVIVFLLISFHVAYPQTDVPPGYSFAGRVVDSKGAPVPKGKVFFLVYGYGIVFFTPAIVGKDGRFSCASYGPGHASQIEALVGEPGPDIDLRDFDFFRMIESIEPESRIQLNVNPGKQQVGDLPVKFKWAVLKLQLLDRMMKGLPSSSKTWKNLEFRIRTVTGETVSEGRAHKGIHSKESSYWVAVPEGRWNIEVATRHDNPIWYSVETPVEVTGESTVVSGRVVIDAK